MSRFAFHFDGTHLRVALASRDGGVRTLISDRYRSDGWVTMGAPDKRLRNPSGGPVAWPPLRRGAGYDAVERNLRTIEQSLARQLREHYCHTEAEFSAARREIEEEGRNLGRH